MVAGLGSCSPVAFRESGYDEPPTVVRSTQQDFTLALVARGRTAILYLSKLRSSRSTGQDPGFNHPFVLSSHYECTMNDVDAHSFDPFDLKI